MSWELSCLLSVSIVCGTIAFIFKGESHEGESDKLWHAINEILARLQKLEATNDSVHKLADDTKKLLSQENLSRSLGARR